MFRLLILLSSCVLLSTAYIGLYMNDETLALREECVSKLNSTEKVEEKALAESCYYKCVFEKKGILNDDGSISKENLNQKLQHQQPKESEEKKNCFNVVEKVETCEDLKPVIECLRQVNHKFRESAQMMKMKRECLYKNSLWLQDLSSNKQPEETPRNRLCFFKCMMEKEGILDRYGRISKEKIYETYKNLPAEIREMKKSCFKAVKMVATCKDVKPIKECLDKVNYQGKLIHF